MKYQIFAIALFAPLVLTAQSQDESLNGFFEQLTSNAIILSEEGLVKGTQEIKNFVDDFVSSKSRKYSYEQSFNINVSPVLDYESGELTVNSKLYSVMFLQRKDGNSGPGIEFLVIYEKRQAQTQLSEIDQSREEWMRLCNAHLADELVEQMYSSDAYYYNRGRLLKGTKSLSAEYSYMNSPTYSLKLTPKYVSFVTADKVFEIGQCSGSYPKPYMILWGKQDDGRWVVLMDSND